MPERIGRYRVLQVLGEGHFGAVYLCDGEVPARGPRASRHRSVAIKQLRGEWTMRAFETLVREFELLDRVKHRSLCRVYEFLDRECAVVMEYVEGSTLRQLLEAHAEVGEAIWPDAALEIGIELADCLYQAHATPGASGEALLLVHRDIKPENVMITPTGEVKLLDFGLARIDDGVRDVGVKGTPLYMAPEQARGDGVDHRTDLFSLGLVLFELVSGSPAYPVPSRDRDSEIEALMTRIERADVASGLRALRQAHPDVAEPIAALLAPRAADRPEDGHVAMMAFRRAIGRRGALAEFAAYTFGPLGPLATQSFSGSVAAGVLDPHPASPTGSAAAPAASAGMPAMMYRTTTGTPDPEHAPQMSKPLEPRPPARPSSSAARPRPQPLAKPGRPEPAKMWTPADKPAEPSPPSSPSMPPGQELRMVPISDEEGAISPIKGGATSFFAMPAARRKDPSEGASELRRSDPIAAASTPMGAPPAGPPVGGYVPMGAVPPQPMMMPMGISGPVAAGYPGMPMPATMPPDTSGDVQRARSYRVFAVVMMLTGMVFAVMVAAVILIFSVVMLQPADTDTDRTPPLGVIAPPPAPSGGGVDTGVVAPEVKDKKPPKPSPGPRPDPVPRPPPAPPPTKEGPVKITLGANAPVFTSMEIVCDTAAGKYRQRTDFVNGTSVQPNVPKADCTLYFKGGTPANAKVTGGQTLTCAFIGAQPKCE